MKAKLSRKEVQQMIEGFFLEKKKFDPKYVKKIKRLAMKYNVKLGKHRKLFCKKCFSDLRGIRGKMNKDFKTIECGECGQRARWKIKIF